jgi:SAM-dependent methyltransferase/uncharacterized protein YbaR (Trm112 family)
MKVQPVTNQKAEIEFRKKLYSQQVEGKSLLDDEFDSAAMENILRDRMSTTLARMVLLRDKAIPLSPYIEIGAERCQRSLVMENDLGAVGAAIDISFDLLRSCRYYQEVFSKAKAPTRICCDANNLPFMTSSIPFVFCYETLHHFPEPAPVVEEIRRVLLPGGFFFFDEEPYKRVLHIDLYSGGRIYSQQYLRRSTMRQVLDRLFSSPGSNEVEHGVIENDDISITQWKRAFKSFATKEVQLRPTQHSGVQSDLFNPSSYLKYWVLFLLGGTISGICQKTAEGIHRSLSLFDTLICPSCKQTGSEITLSRENRAFVCTKCLKVYPVVDDVIFLFAHDKLAQLYPDIFQSCEAKHKQAG